MADRTPSGTQLTLVLSLFFVVGGGAAFFVWHTLSDFLAGKPVEGGRYLLGLAMTGVFVGIAWLLARYILSAFGAEGTDGDSFERGPPTDGGKAHG